MGFRNLALPVGILIGALPFLSHGSVVVFNNIPSPTQTGYDSSYYSHGFEAQNTAELGNVVGLAGTARTLNTVTITMVTHAKSADWQAMYQANNAGWYHSIMLTVWKADASEILATQTISTLVPWANPDPNQSGTAFNVGFNFASENITLPNTVLVSVAYNTQNDGFSPIGTAGPYNALNYGTFDYAPFVGTDVTPGAVMRVFSEDTETIVFETAPGWNDRTPMMEITATEASQAPYDVWIASYGYTVGTSPALRSDDPDGDGMNNLTEFAFGTDPTFNTASPIEVSQASDTEVRVTFLQRNDSAVTYDPRLTTDLEQPFTNWTIFTPSTSSDQTSLPRSNYTRVEVLLDAASYDRTFVKVNAAEVQ